MQILKCFIGDIANGEMEKVFDDCSQYRGIWYIYRIYGRNVFNPGSDNKQIQERTVDAKGEKLTIWPTLRVS